MRISRLEKLHFLISATAVAKQTALKVCHGNRIETAIRQWEQRKHIAKLTFSNECHKTFSELILPGGRIGVLFATLYTFCFGGFRNAAWFLMWCPQRTASKGRMSYTQDLKLNTEVNNSAPTARSRPVSFPCLKKKKLTNVTLIL